MSLQLSLNIQKYGLGLQNAYIRLLAIDYHYGKSGKDSFRYGLSFGVYPNHEVADLSNCRPTDIINLTVSVSSEEQEKINMNPVKWAYEQLKKQEAFLEAKDV